MVSLSAQALNGDVEETKAEIISDFCLLFGEGYEERKSMFSNLLLFANATGADFI